MSQLFREESGATLIAAQRRTERCSSASMSWSSHMRGQANRCRSRGPGPMERNPRSRTAWRSPSLGTSCAASIEAAVRRSAVPTCEPTEWFEVSAHAPKRRSRNRSPHGPVHLRELTNLRWPSRPAQALRYASVLTLPSSANACSRRVTKLSSPARSQERGSYFFLFGASSPSGLPICPCR